MVWYTTSLGGCDSVRLDHANFAVQPIGSNRESGNSEHNFLQSVEDWSSISSVSSRVVAMSYVSRRSMRSRRRLTSAEASGRRP